MEAATLTMASGEARLMRAPPGPLEGGRQAGEEWDSNGQRIKFCWCPPGEFKMGEATNQVDVKLTKGFWLGKTEVTQGQWFAVMGTKQAEWGAKPDTKAGDDYPATWVSWDEATKFCEELTKQERAAGRLPDGWEYRLPTEAQWEYACRAGTQTAYSFGDDEKQLGDYAWYDANTKNAGEGYAHQVATKLPNPWGLHDVHGNVWEWCRDWHAAQLPGGTDPEVAERASNRVARGDSWSNDAGLCRSARRRGYTREFRLNYLGFRLALVQSR